MLKNKLLVVFSFVFVLISLTACNDTTYIYDANNESGEESSLIESKSSDNEDGPSQNEKIIDSTSSSNSEDSTDESSSNTDESNSKIKNEGTLDDGIDWGPLQ